MALIENFILNSSINAFQLARRWISGFFNMKIALTILTGFVLASFANHNEQDISANEINKEIENYIQKVIDKFEISGLTIAIIQEGSTIYTSAFGVRDLNTNEPLKPEYIFHMASVSKPFVATAVMQLVEQGKMNLDQPVVSYLP